MCQPANMHAPILYCTVRNEFNGETKGNACVCTLVLVFKITGLSQAVSNPEI